MVFSLICVVDDKIALINAQRRDLRLMNKFDARALSNKEILLMSVGCCGRHVKRDINPCVNGKR